MLVYRSVSRMFLDLLGIPASQKKNPDESISQMRRMGLEYFPVLDVPGS